MAQFSLLLADETREILTVAADSLAGAIQEAVLGGVVDADIYEDGAYVYSMLLLPSDPAQWLIFRKTETCLEKEGASLMLSDNPAAIRAYG